MNKQAKTSKRAPLVPEEQAYIAMARTHGLLSQRVDQFFREHGLTSVTYNILRILRGAGPQGLTCSEVSRRLLTRVPDVTRIMDRLTAKGLVERQRVEEDRRIVLLRITDTGSELLARMDKPLRDIHIAQFGHMKRGELKELIALLQKARQSAGE